MSEYILALVTSKTSSALFEVLPAGWQPEIKLVQSAADAFKQLGQPGECRLILIDRDAEPQLQRLVQRIRRSRPGLQILLLTPAVSENVRGQLQAWGVDLLDRGSPKREILDEIHRLFERATFQARVGILGRSPLIHAVLETILQIGPTSIPVLITGPSGSGKELVATALHTISPRANRPYVALNVGALAESVLESELFGHERGAFTGAVARKAGVFERAHLGTLFLDEVGEMSPHMQVRLLRALESGEVLSVGGSQPQRFDVRVLAATNRDLENAVRKGDFREDLYYRLKVVQIHLPSLAERPEDLAQLVQHFLNQAAQQYDQPIRSLSEDALRALQNYSWPGNIRELRNVVFSLAVLAKGERITEDELPEQLRRPATASQLPVATYRTHEQAERDIILQSLLALRHDLQEVLLLLRQQRSEPASAIVVEQEGEKDAAEQPLNLRQTEKEIIRNALESAHGNRRLAAQRLGIAERTLYRKLKKYGL